jgi:hypothetical protein
MGQWLGSTRTITANETPEIKTRGKAKLGLFAVSRRNAFDGLEIQVTREQLSDLVKRAQVVLTQEVCEPK